MKKSINRKELILGILLNILVIIVFILIYHAYIVSPRFKEAGINGSVEQTAIPGENIPAVPGE